MTRRDPRSLLDVDDHRVNAVLIILGITLGNAIAAFITRAGQQVRRDDTGLIHLRMRVTLGLRVLRVQGGTLSYPEIARLVGAPHHSTVISRCQSARRLGLLTESQIHALRGSEAPFTHTPANPAGEHA